MSNAFYVPFVSVYLRNVGFSNLVIGTVFAIRPFLGFVSSPFWGFCADRSGKHKLVLVFVIIVTGVTRLSLLLMDSQVGRSCPALFARPALSNTSIFGSMARFST